MDQYTFRLVEANREMRLAGAAQAQQSMQGSVSFPLHARLRLALSKCLITWGARLYVPPPPNGRVGDM